MNEEKQARRRKVRKLSRSSRSVPIAVKIGVRMKISDEGLAFIEEHDPDLAEIIKQKNPRFR